MDAASTSLEAEVKSTDPNGTIASDDERQANENSDTKHVELGVNVERIKAQALKLNEAQDVFHKYNNLMHIVVNTLAIMSILTGSVLIGLIWSVRSIISLAVTQDFEARSLVANMTYYDEFMFNTAEVLLSDPENHDLWLERYELGLDEHNGAQTGIQQQDLPDDIREGFNTYSLQRVHLSSIQREAIETNDDSLLHSPEYIAEEEVLHLQIEYLTEYFDKRTVEDRNEGDSLLKIMLGFLIFDILFLFSSVAFIYNTKKKRLESLVKVRQEIQESQRMLSVYTSKEPTKETAYTGDLEKDLIASESEGSKSFNRTLGAFSLLVITITAILIYCNAALDVIVVDRFDTDYRIIALHGEFLLQDEEMTMTAYAAAFSGDFAFFERYHEGRKALQETISEIEELVPQITTSLEVQTRDAMENIVSLQNDIFADVESQSDVPYEERDMTTAQAIISSEEYQEYSDALLQGASLVFGFVDREATEALSTANTLAIMSIVFVMLWIPFNVLRYFLTRKNQQHQEDVEEQHNKQLEWNMRRLLDTTDTRQMLENFAKNAHCVEHVECDDDIGMWLLKSEQAQVQSELKELLHGARDLFDKYFRRGVEKEINISARLNKSIKTSLAALERRDGTVDCNELEKLKKLYLSAQGECVSLLEDNIHIKFINSEEFERFLETRKDAIQQQIKIIEMHARVKAKNASTVPADEAAIVDDMYDV